MRYHQVPHAAVTVAKVPCFHIEAKQQFPSEGLQEYQDLKGKGLQ